jgi:hypothetical protein
LTDSATPNPASEPPAPELVEAPAPELVEAPAPAEQPVAVAAEPQPEPVVAPAAIPVAEAAPLAVSAPAEAPAAGGESTDVLGLPLKLLNELLARIGATPLQSLTDLLPLLRILSLAVVAGIALKLTSATLGAIDDLPLVGGLLELVGLVSLLNFLARNAFKQQKRAELLARIQKLKTDLLG